MLGITLRSRFLSLCRQTRPNPRNPPNRNAYVMPMSCMALRMCTHTIPGNVLLRLVVHRSGQLRPASSGTPRPDPAWSHDVEHPAASPASPASPACLPRAGHGRALHRCREVVRECGRHGARCSRGATERGVRRRPRRVRAPCARAARASHGRPARRVGRACRRARVPRRRVRSLPRRRRRRRAKTTRGRRCGWMVLSRFGVTLPISWGRSSVDAPLSRHLNEIA